MTFTQIGPNASADFQGDYNDVQGDQNNRFIGTIMHGRNQTYRADTIIIYMGSNSAAESSAQRTSQPVVGPSDEAPTVAAQCPLQTWQRKVIEAADNMSGLIASIIRLLENRTEYFDIYRDLELPVELLHHATIMSRLATLEILGPRGRNLASTTEQVVLGCRKTLQELFVKLKGHQDLRVTGILLNHVPRRFQRQELCRIKKRLETQGVLWNHAPRRFQRQELFRIKRRLETLLAALTESPALTSYVDDFRRLHFTSLPGVGK